MPTEPFPGIDLHVHFVPQSYKQAVGEKTEADQIPVPQWTPQIHLETMDRLNIATAMLSISRLHDVDANAARRLAREVNEIGAALVRDHPARFGLMAVLPLPDVDSSLAEIAYALDVLHADGLKVPTNARGVYLGDARLDPIFAELSRRQAVVIIHPHRPSAVPAGVLEGYPISMLEFLFDTTRAVTNMIMNRTLERYPDLKLVLPHAGAFLSVLAERLTGRRKHFAAPGQENVAPDIHAALRKLYYDLAGYPIPGQMLALRRIVGTDRMLYGSDWPYTPEPNVLQLRQDLLTTDLLTDEERRAVFYGNARALFPRLAQQAKAQGASC